MRTWEVGESKGWEDLDKHEEEEIKKKKGFNGEVRKKKKRNVTRSWGVFERKENNYEEEEIKLEAACVGERALDN